MYDYDRLIKHSHSIRSNRFGRCRSAHRGIQVDANWYGARDGCFQPEIGATGGIMALIARIFNSAVLWKLVPSE
jgi:hypothetical protein